VKNTPDGSQPSSGRRYPARPVVGVGAVIVHEGRVLLVQRGREPLRGHWSIPGGAVETGETLETALRREVLEETGLTVNPLFLTAVFERLMPDAKGRTEFHYVLIDYVCTLPPGTEPHNIEHAGDDAQALGWFDLEEAQTLQMTAGTLDVVAKALLAYDCWRATGESPCAGLYLGLPTGDYGEERESA
jgi:8-oxo-dGTP diphosphatase